MKTFSFKITKVQQGDIPDLQLIFYGIPYFRHTDDMIHKLESAGLGYHVKTDESDDRLGMN